MTGPILDRFALNIEWGTGIRARLIVSASSPKSSDKVDRLSSGVLGLKRLAWSPSPSLLPNPLRVRDREESAEGREGIDRALQRPLRLGMFFKHAFIEGYPD